MVDLNKIKREELQGLELVGSGSFAVLPAAVQRGLALWLIFRSMVRCLQLFFDITFTPCLWVQVEELQAELKLQRQKNAALVSTNAALVSTLSELESC